MPKYLLNVPGEARAAEPTGKKLIKEWVQGRNVQEGHDNMVDITWINHAGFLVSSGDDVIYFDPYQAGDDLPEASLILVSHEHYDHADGDSIRKLSDGSTVVVCPKTCVKGLKEFHPVGLEPGETKTVAGIPVTGFPAYTFPGKKFHPRENQWLGYIIKVEGKKIYHAGDCDIMEEMKELADAAIDVALLPVGDKGYTMDFDDAARATTYIKPRVIVPMHDWDQDLDPFIDLVKETAPGVRVEILRDKKLSL